MHGRVTTTWCGVVGTALLLAALGGCSAGKGHAARAELSVFAASSLKEAFEHLERAFEAAHPEADLRLTFAGSQVLRLQIEQGARADVFASANEGHMAELAGEGLVTDVQVFATNTLALAVSAGAPAIHSFAALPRAQRIVLGSDHVPVGVYADALLARAEGELGPDFVRAVRRRVVSRENNVRLVRAKVELGEADAALVYASDLQGVAGVRAVSIPEGFNVRARYPIGITTAAAHPHWARKLLRFVGSTAGQRILQQHGFGAATTP